MWHKKAIILALIVASVVCAHAAYAEAEGSAAAAAQVDEKAYEKNIVPIDAIFAKELGYPAACDLPVLVKKDVVEYYRSADGMSWVSAGDRQLTLQSRYNKKEDIVEKVRLKRMRQDMYNMGRRDMQDVIDNKSGM